MAEKPPVEKATEVFLVAAWPGMGNVAVIAAGYLVQALGMQPVAELAARGFFDVQQITVEKGMIETPHMPRSLLYRWRHPEHNRELLVFLGESQPTNHAYTFAHELLDRTVNMGATRVVTFASLASQLHPTDHPRVFGAATDAPSLEVLQRLEVQPLQEGQIGGLNGVLLGAASERGMPGVCLLGEIPFFAAGVPNPKAAAAVLRIFADIAKIEIDLAELEQHSEAVEQAMLDLMRRMSEAAQEEGDAEDEDDEESPFSVSAADVPATPPPTTPEPPQPTLDAATKGRIEKLFNEARKDRRRAMRLKEELDKHGVFKQYEDRFLDLFKRAE